MDLLADVSNQQISHTDSQISHLALDIGGSLIKLVYLSRNNNNCGDDDQQRSQNDSDTSEPLLGGRLHFVKFETSKIYDCLEFIRSNKLCLDGLHDCTAPAGHKVSIKATGGGAYKFSDLFKEKLGISLDKEDEMDCLVTGANFLLKAVHQEAFTYLDGQKEYLQIDHKDLYLYLVNIGSGVSMIKGGWRWQV